jgi:oxygen-independent coproporphyrinogen-3 oxidase
MNAVQFDPDLIRRYEVSGPRYTSYPTAVQFTSAFGADAYRSAVLESRERAATKALSLYVHIPFCSSPCFYCGCNRIITRSRDRAEAYLARLRREIQMQAALFGRARNVEQLHFGGGTPTFLEASELAALMEHLRHQFSLSDSASREFSIEIDPRTVTPDSVHALAAMGFNRMSLGVQDFDPAVQAAVNRIQPESTPCAWWTLPATRASSRSASISSMACRARRSQASSARSRWC